MTRLRTISFVIFKCILLINLIWCSPSTFDQNIYNVFKEDTLNHLIQSNTNPLLKYKSVDIKNAQFQNENSINVRSDIELDCNSNAEYCPSSKKLECDSIFIRSDENKYILDLNTFRCQPIGISDDNHRRGYCAGCAHDLNINATGISTFTDAAISHLQYETKIDYTFVQVLRIQRQILETVPYGVKYFLTLEVKRPLCRAEDVQCIISDENANQICYVMFLEKPSFDNKRHIIANNCTESQQYTYTLPQTFDRHNDQSNEIDVNYSVPKLPDPINHTRKTEPNFEQIAQLGHTEDADPNYESIVPSRIDEIESQIVPIRNESSQMISENKKAAIEGLLDIFDFDAEPKFKHTTQTKLESVANERLTPIEEPIIVPVKAVVSYEGHEHIAPKIETVVIGVADSNMDGQNVTEDVFGESQMITDDNLRNRRDLSGSKLLQLTSPDEKEFVENLAQIAVSTLDNIDTDEHKRVVLKILTSKKLISDGITYHLSLKVGISECMESMDFENPKDSVDKDTLERKCRNTLLSNLTMICKVQIHVKNDKTNPKVVKSQCQNLKRTGERNNRTGGRYRRGLKGGPTSIETYDDEFYKKVHKGLNQLDENSNELTRWKMTKVLSATSQVVAGSLTKIKVQVGLTDFPKSQSPTFKDRENSKLLDNPKIQKCKIVIWEKLWENFEQITTECDDASSNSKRNRREIKVGAPVSIDTNSDEFIQILHIGLNKLDELSNELNRVKVTKVINATKQLVSGILIKMNVEVGLSDLPKSVAVSFNDRQNANLLDDPKLKTCTISIWNKPWLKENGFQIYAECDEPNFLNNVILNRSRRGLVGGPTKIQTYEGEFFEDLHKGLNKLDEMSDGSTRLKMIEVISATTRIVAGSFTEIKLKVGFSDLPKTNNVSFKDRQNSKLLKNSDIRECKIQIWQKPWENFEQITTECDSSLKSKRSRRQIIGGPVPLNTYDDDFYEKVHKGLNKLDEESNESTRLKMIEVVSATTQVVAGSLTKIKVKVGLSDLQKSNNVSFTERQHAKLLERPKFQECKIKIWEKPWENFEQITTECDSSLKSKRSRRQIPGGPVPLNTYDDDFYEKVHKGLNKLDEESNESTRLKMIEIVSATTQVVAGSLTKIKVKVGLSNLSKSNKITFKDRQNAQLLEQPKVQECKIKIWEKPWENFEQITTECDSLLKSNRNRRQISERINLINSYDDESYDNDKVHAFSLFQNFVKKFNKTYYSQMEMKKRYNIFTSNMKIWEEFNKNEQGTATYGPTIFADMSRKEFEQYLGYKPSLRSYNDVPLPHATIPNIDIPDSFDWRTKNAVTEVKNQGACGSCWAFSVTGNVEGQYAIKSGKLLEFSEQELVDCDKLDDGCGGGLMDNAYRSIESLGGLETENDYPYEAENEKCHFDRTKIRVQLKGAVNITSDEVGMAKWLVKNGPISIAINANAMQFYMGGISHPWKFLCNPKQLDHGVLIVGYGVHTNKFFNKTMPFWIIKNSWGPHWGEQGYYRVLRGAGTCGLNQTPSSAILED